MGIPFQGRHRRHRRAGSALPDVGVSARLLVAALLFAALAIGALRLCLDAAERRAGAPTAADPADLLDAGLPLPADDDR